MPQLSNLIKTVTGVVLAGGRSSRMGTNKALLPLDGRMLIDRSLSIIQQCFAETLVIVDDDEPGCGPLGGIVSALRRAPAIFVVACDMPFLDPNLIRDMAGMLPGNDAVAILSEPLHAGYGRSALLVGQEQLTSGDYAAHRFLGRLRAKYLSESELSRYPNWRKSLTNINTPQEWEAAKQYGPVIPFRNSSMHTHGLASHHAVHLDVEKTEPALDAVSVRYLFISPGHNYKGHHGAVPDAHPILEVDCVECVAGKGLRGDRYFGHAEDYKGQITFFAWEVYHNLCEQFAVCDKSPSALRRNVITEGLDLNALVGKEFDLQGVRFFGTEECQPCYWMDHAFASGAEKAMRSRGGLRARILTNGTLRRGACFAQP